LSTFVSDDWYRATRHTEAPAGRWRWHRSHVLQRLGGKTEYLYMDLGRFSSFTLAPLCRSL
jgi:hypothetical protein